MEGLAGCAFLDAGRRTEQRTNLILALSYEAYGRRRRNVPVLLYLCGLRLRIVRSRGRLCRRAGNTCGWRGFGRGKRARMHQPAEVSLGILRNIASGEEQETNSQGLSAQTLF